MNHSDIRQLPRLAALELKPDRAKAYNIPAEQPVFLLEVQDRKGYKVPWIRGLAGAPGYFKPQDFKRYLGYQGEAIAQ